MKNKHNKKITTRIGTLVLGLGLIGTGLTSTIGQVMADDVSNPSQVDPRSIIPGIEKAYGEDPFSPEYSKGILFPTGTGTTLSIVPSGNKITTCTNTANNVDMWCGVNTTRENDIYITIKNGAIYNNKFYDVREYLWITGENVKWAYSKTMSSIMVFRKDTTADFPPTATVHREIHFYNAGTNNEVEFEFKGVAGFNDLEEDEGYKFDQHGYHQAYVKNPTALKEPYDGSGRFNYTWLGTETSLEDIYNLWAEVQGDKNNPLLLDYIVPAVRGTTGMQKAFKVNYNINSAPTGNFDYIVEQGSIMPEDPDEVPEGKAFDGWYLDETMTDKVTEPIKITKETNLYGKYVDLAKITTSIKNGTITDTKDVPLGTKDYKVEYACDDDYSLSTLKIDDEEVDTEEFPDSYTFEEITKSHTISAVCKELKVPDTGSLSSSNYGADSTTGGSVNVGVLLISSLVSITGFALIYRFVKHSKAMSFKK